MNNKENIQAIASEFSGDEKKLIYRLADDEIPTFSPNSEFKNKVDAKLQEKIKFTISQRQEQAALDAVPRKMKWRFYLTGYGYAVCSFLVLFLIGFCTNIFTGTLKIPSKYTYLEKTQAFGSINQEKLVYNYDADRASNFTYNDSIYDYAEDDIAENEGESVMADSEETSSNTVIQNFMAKGVGATITTADIETSDAGSDDDIFSSDYLLSSNFTFNQTYRFAYKNKLFPKLDSEYAVFKVSGVLMGINTPNQLLKNLKIGDVSLKNFHNLEIMNFEAEQNEENGYTIVFDNYLQQLHFYPNSSREAQGYYEKLPSKKQILKVVNSELKSMGISTKNYGDGIINLDYFDENMGIIQIFYPFKLQGKFVRNATTNEQIGMNVAYDLNTQKIVSVSDIDIATYEVSDYPVLDKSQIETAIEQGGMYYQQGALHENSSIILFDSMEIVYLEKILENGEKLYVPAIKGNVSTSLENYIGPNFVFQEII